MQILNFSYNWNNKLDNKMFTTIRLSDRFIVGDVVQVYCKGKRLNNAQCVTKKIMLLSELDEFTASLDTGYDLKATKTILHKMYTDKNWDTQPIIIYLFKSLQPAKHPKQIQLC